MIKPAFTQAAQDILRDRYLWRDEEQNPTETPQGLLLRVAEAVSKAERTLPLEYKWQDEFYEIMANLYFLPNSPTLMNAGRPAPHGQLAACFVIGIDDTMESICEALRKQMLIHKSGGGTGFNFSNLRAAGSIVASTKGRASGPVSFMGLFDKATETVQQGGMRRGANMGILNIEHEDIREFIHCKDKDGTITNFNISVAISDDFMKKVMQNPVGKEAVLLHEIAESAWKTGDPGVIFIDAINRGNTTPNLGRLEATNPCGESPLYPNEACNLGSINISQMVKNGEFDYELLSHVTAIATRFLDDVIDINCYPLPEISAAVRRTRKIGLGIMGLADTLFQLEIPYDSKEAFDFAGSVMKCIHDVATKTSEELGKEKGIPEDLAHLGRRNATLTCIAPTGTIALLADCSSGIEPVFSLEHTRVRTQLDGTKVAMKYQNKFYEKALKRGMSPQSVRKIFKTSHDVNPKAHIAMQSVFQKYTDLAVSKTINMKHDCTKDDVFNAYVDSWQAGCKGVTIYRDGSKSEQVLYTKSDESKAKDLTKKPDSTKAKYSIKVTPKFVIKSKSAKVEK